MAPTERRDAAEPTQSTHGEISSKGCKEGVSEESMAPHPPTYARAAPLWGLQLTWYQIAVLWILRQGAVPCHVAIGPDGNRRFAKTVGIELRAAYDILFRKLVMVFHCMAVLGVSEVTTILFGTSNFIRRSYDVDAIFDEITRFCATTLNSLDLLQPPDFWMPVAGDLELIPKELQAKLAQLEVATSGGSGVTTNRICTASSTKLHMRHMAKHLARAVKRGVLESDDITWELIEEDLDLCEGPEAELWYRSSGEPRFSEFFTLQSGYAYMHIEPKLWPSVQFWDWVRVVLHYQVHWPTIKAVKDRHRSILKSGHNRVVSIERRLRQRTFLARVEAERTAYIQGYCSATEESH